MVLLGDANLNNLILDLKTLRRRKGELRFPRLPTPFPIQLHLGHRLAACYGSRLFILTGALGLEI